MSPESELPAFDRSVTNRDGRARRVHSAARRPPSWRLQRPQGLKGWWRICVVACAFAAAASSSATRAGPPFLTDGIEPTPTGHWEIYALFEAEGQGADFSGSIGAELNYGPVKDVQLMLGLRAAFAHAQSGYQ